MNRIQTFLLAGLLCGLILSAAVGRAADPPPCDELVVTLDALVPQLLDKHHTPGVSIAVIHSRQIALEKCYGVQQVGSAKPVDCETVFEAASMSKPLFAFGVMKLVECGKLDLDRPLVKYLDSPYLADEPLHQKITARMVLQHTSGFPNWRKGGWRAGGPLPVNFEPGTKFGYSGEGFWYLQQVVEKIANEELEPWIQRTVLQPLEMTSSSFIWRDELARRVATGHDADGKTKTNGKRFTRANAAFTLFTTPRDFARFLIAMMPDAQTKPLLLTQGSLNAMLQPAVLTDKPQEWRGLGWVVTKRDDQSFAWHSGSNGTGFRCYSRFEPEQGSGVVIMTNSLAGEAVWKKIEQAVCQ